MKAEFGKYYILNNDKYYFSVELQRNIKFNEPLIIKCGSGFFKTCHFGYLINTGIGNTGIGNDVITDNEIEFSDEDVVSEYFLRVNQINFVDF
jgi:hypothetical protein